MKNFRGQAALEFMMTYGWAILVVLAAIGALSYFGILNPSKFTPDTCLASSGFACPGKPIFNASGVAFTIVNGLGYPIVLSNAAENLSVTPVGTFTGCSWAVCTQGTVNCYGTNSQPIDDGSGVTVVGYGCTGFANVQVVKGELHFNYLNPQSKLTETLIVSVTGKPIK